MSQQSDHPSLIERVKRLLRPYQLGPMMERYQPRAVLALFSLVNGFLSIAMISIVAIVSRGPFVFPSAGATALVLFTSPLAPSSSPRNVILAHLVGATAGWLAVLLFGLSDAGPALPDHMTWSRALAAAMSLSITGGIMVFWQLTHPPAGATALIVSLGLLPHLAEVAVLMLAILLLVGQAMVINRLAGLRYPIWAPFPEPTPPRISVPLAAPATPSDVPAG